MKCCKDCGYIMGHAAWCPTHPYDVGKDQKFQRLLRKKERRVKPARVRE